MNELIIHAGLNKTGTTSIQHSLSSNDVFLEKYNYEYIKIENIRGKKLINHSVAIISLFREKPENYHVNRKNNWDVEQVNKHYEQQLNKLAKRRGQKKIIISGEGISSLSEIELERLRNFFGDYKIRVIIYIRDPYYTLCSRLQQAIQKGSNVHLNNILPGYIKINVASRIIVKFKKVFPDTEFYSYDDSRLDGGPVIHFLNLLGVEILEGFVEKRMNEGLIFPRFHGHIVKHSFSIHTASGSDYQ